MTDLESELIVRYMDKFGEEREYMNKLNESQEFYIDQERYNKWLEDFPDNVKNEKDREFVKEMFAIDE